LVRNRRRYQVVGFVGGVLAELARPFAAGALNELSELLHEVPGHVVTVLALGEGQVAHRTGWSNIDFFWLVDVDLSLLRHKLFVLKQRVQTRVAEGEVLGQVVELVTGVAALVATEDVLLGVQRAVNVLGQIL